ncbi:hypothetical protein EVAR_80152_1 [Eumeta japonica]|uniref:Uncharacterized protein n=1 Tax=Eumeta variegata TaxID=151549 RepID=A0A4C1YEE0_EUMVA|nr:hypothetical protein EVAR_80152_1 [Eumeta japonica]
MRYMPPAPIRSLISRSELRLDRTKNHMPIRGDTLCCQMCLLKYAIRSRTDTVYTSLVDEARHKNMAAAGGCASAGLSKC